MSLHKLKVLYIEIERICMYICGPLKKVSRTVSMLVHVADYLTQNSKYEPFQELGRFK